MEKKFDPSRVDAIATKVKQGSGETATYAASVFQSLMQSLAASNPRPDDLQKIILNIVRENPAISENDLLRELHRQAFGVISAIEDGQIEWDSHTGRARSTPVSALKDRLSRAKKFLRNSR